MSNLKVQEGDKVILTKESYWSSQCNLKVGKEYVVDDINERVAIRIVHTDYYVEINCFKLSTQEITDWKQELGG